MLEYLYDAIRASAGTDLAITAQVTDELGNPITAGVSLVIHKTETDMIMISGTYFNDMWVFEIPAALTEGLKGRYWYCIKHENEQLCFKQPIYFV